MPNSAPNQLESAADIVASDLQNIVEQLNTELTTMAGKRLLITGGAGFLGYYLVQAILHWNQHHDAKQQIDLTLFDNFIRGMPRWLADLRDRPGIALQTVDLRHPLPANLPEFAYIIHAAGIASPQYYRQRPLETMDANVNGLRSLLELAKQQHERGQPIEGMLFFSSSEIYGDPPADQIPTPETFRGLVSCTGPRACYDESKRYGETLCVVFAQQCNIPITIARPFNNYGPGLKITDRRVLPDFCRCILAGEPIVMYSDGSPTRTFCYSSDAIVGYYKVLVRGRPGEAYNIGTPTPEISMKQLAEMAVQCGRELWGYEGEIIHQASPEAAYLVDNPNRRCPSIDKARKDLGYHPQVELSEGLRRTLLWYREHQQATEA